MPTRNLRRGAAVLGAALPNIAPIYVDSDDNKLKMIPAGSGTTEVEIVDASSTQTLTNKTFTSPTVNSPTLTTPTINNPAISGPTPVTNTSGTVVAVAATHANRTTVLSKAAGGTVALPAATGTGNKYRFVVGVTLTSVSWVISKAGSDTFFGNAIVNNTGDTTALTADAYQAAAGNNTFTLAFANLMGIKGDIVEFEDTAAAEWTVSALLTSVDPVTPFSTV